MKVIPSAEFTKWLNQIDFKERIDARISKIEEENYFGDWKPIKNSSVLELRWRNGWRVYFGKINKGKEECILLLIGGSKNEQKKDIEKAKNILQRYTSS